jgi:hypothetical protein
MSGAWRKSFHYDYFRELLLTAKDNFGIKLVRETSQVQAAGAAPTLILRHDVDISLKRALPMAEIEHGLEISSTYMVMVDSPLYDLNTPESQKIIHDLMDMGHEVALHFTAQESPAEDGWDQEELESQVIRAKVRLEDIIQAEVASISFHRPIARFLRGPFRIFDLVNAYSRELMEWYLSDSGGRWREGEPVPKLRQPAKPLLQLLIHPIWWGRRHLGAEDRLEEFYQSEARSSAVAPADLDRGLASTLGIRRRGLSLESPPQDRHIL